MPALIQYLGLVFLDDPDGKQYNHPKPIRKRTNEAIKDGNAISA